MGDRHYVYWECSRCDLSGYVWQKKLKKPECWFCESAERVTSRRIGTYR